MRRIFGQLPECWPARGGGSHRRGWLAAAARAAWLARSGGSRSVAGSQRRLGQCGWLAAVARAAWLVRGGGSRSVAHAPFRHLPKHKERETHPLSGDF
jgi:hypothetical protein